MKIVYVINGLDIGGAEMMLLKLVQTLDLNLFQVRVVTLGKGGGLQGQFESAGVKVINLNLSFGRFLSCGFKLKRLIAEFKPDIIHSWMYHANFFSAIWTSSKRPLIWGIRYSLSNLKHDKLLTRLLIKVSPFMDSKVKVILFNSALSSNQHQQIGYDSKKCQVIPNGIDCHKWKPAPDQKDSIRLSINMDPNHFLIGFVGRYDPIKDVDTFLSAAQIFSRDHELGRFVMIGPGHDRQNKTLIEKINEKQLKGKVFLLGPRDDIHQLLPGLDILTLCSKAEAFPNVLIEGMACGIPCVSTDVGDAKIVMGETGLIVEPQNAENLARAWNELLEIGDASRRLLGMKGRQKVEEDYEINVISRKIYSLYQTLINQP